MWSSGYMVVALLAALVAGVTCTASPGPTTRTGPEPSWLALRWIGRQHESVPPLILYVTDDDRREATRAAGATETMARLSDEEFRAVMRWLDDHPAPAAAAKRPAEFACAFGARDATLADRPMSTDGTRAFLAALKGEGKEEGLALPKGACEAAAAFGKHYGL